MIKQMVLLGLLVSLVFALPYLPVWFTDTDKLIVSASVFGVAIFLAVASLGKIRL